MCKERISIVNYTRPFLNVQVKSRVARPFFSFTDIRTGQKESGELRIVFFSHPNIKEKKRSGHARLVKAWLCKTTNNYVPIARDYQ